MTLSTLAQYDITIPSLVYDAFKVSKANGFHDRDDVTFGDRIALVHSELSEALEEFRAGHDFDEVYYNEAIDPKTGDTVLIDKPEGIPIELADAVIRIADICGRYGIDLQEALRIKQAYNKTRTYRHGNKRI